MSIFDRPRLNEKTTFQIGITNRYGVNLCEMLGHSMPSLNLNDYPVKDTIYYRHEPEVTKIFNKGIAASKDSNDKNAIRWYQDALSYESEYKYHIIFNLANCLMRISEFEEALFYYEEGISFVPDQESWQRYSWNLNLAKINVEERGIRMESMKFPQSDKTGINVIKATEKIIIDQQDLNSWFERGIALLELSLWDQAIHSFNQVLILDKSKHEAWYLKDYAFVKSKENCVTDTVKE